MNPFKKGDVVEVIEAWDTEIINDGEVYTVVEDNEYWVRIECPRCAEGYIGGWEPSRFKLVQRPPSFKHFLSPMCRVELRNGDKYAYVRGEFVNLVEVVGSESQYQADGSIMPQYSCPLSNELEIVRVYAEPAHLADLLNPENVGKILWECPELVAVRKVKEQKVAEIQKEIKEWEAKRESNLLQANSATSVINDLEKQLKEIE